MKGVTRMSTSEHNVGFPFAHDTNGILVSASEAPKGEFYFCPFCNCEMFPKTSHLGTDFFAKRKGAEHKHKICKSIEKTGKYYSFAASENPASLIATFCHASVSRLLKIPASLDEEFDKEDKQPKRELPQVSSFAPFKTLAQVHEYGQFQSNPFEKCGDYRISDYYIHYKWANLFFMNPDFELGARIIHARFFSYDSPNLTLRFITFKKNEFQIFFDVRFTKKETFYSILKKVRVLTKDDTTHRTQPQNMDALIASTDWTYLGNNVYHTTILNAKQIYPIPPEK